MHKNNDIILINNWFAVFQQTLSIAEKEIWRAGRDGRLLPLPEKPFQPHPRAIGVPQPVQPFVFDRIRAKHESFSGKQHFAQVAEFAEWAFYFPDEEEVRLGARFVRYFIV